MTFGAAGADALPVEKANHSPDRRFIQENQRFSAYIGNIKAPLPPRKSLVDFKSNEAETGDA
jgi:hypothetical protein